jgi:hypothetical protein
MNTQVDVIAPEVLEYLPAKTLLKLVEQAQKVKRWTTEFQLTVRSFPALFRRLEELDIDPIFSLANGDINLAFTGDGIKLSEVWKALRTAGYQPNSRPEKGNSTFYTGWCQQGYSRIWMSFSSAVCRRVKVGTKMVEQDIYEVQCGELPEIEADTTAVAVDDDIPF